MYVEKYIASAQHVEVTVLGDEHGHLLHLFERDCSVLRRQTKVVEIAPAVALPLALRNRICTSAVDLMECLHYENAGTVEFLVDGELYYFIEVHPRVLVEHTNSELITGVDIVLSTLRIAAGADLFADLHLPQTDALRENGAEFTCRITTEDPENNYLPDTGTINTYRTPGGFGIRLDVGNAVAGAVDCPYFDSLLVKDSVHAQCFPAAVE